MMGETFPYPRVKTCLFLKVGWADTPVVVSKVLPERFLFHAVLLNQSIGFLGRNRVDFGTCQGSRRGRGFCQDMGKFPHSLRCGVESSGLAVVVPTGTYWQSALLDLDPITGYSMRPSVNRILPLTQMNTNGQSMAIVQYR